MDICLVTIGGKVVTEPKQLQSGRLSFVIECSNSKKGSLLVAITAEKAAVNVIPHVGDYINACNTSYYKETRAGCDFGVYAGCPESVNICARNEGVVDARNL